jgi:hypothetical protein
MKTFNQLISEIMTSSGGGVAGMHQSVTPMDSLPQITGREADRLAIHPKRKKKKKLDESPLLDLMDRHDDPLKFAKAAAIAVKNKKLNLKPRGAANTRELVAAFFRYKRRRKQKAISIPENLSSYWAFHQTSRGLGGGGGNKKPSKIGKFLRKIAKRKEKPLTPYDKKKKEYAKMNILYDPAHHD